MKMELARSLPSRLKGLLGREDFPDVLALVPCHDVHTFGMRRSIDVAFVSADGIVMRAFRNVGPCRRVRCKGAYATLERMADGSPWFVMGDRVDLNATFQ